MRPTALAFAVVLGLALLDGTSLAQTPLPPREPQTRAERLRECIEQCDRIRDTCATMREMREQREQCTQLDTRCRLDCNNQFGDHPGGTAPGPVRRIPGR